MHPGKMDTGSTEQWICMNLYGTGFEYHSRRPRDNTSISGTSASPVDRF